MSDNPRLTTVVVGPLQFNCYLFACPQTRMALVIDPGAEGASASSSTWTPN